MKQLVGAHGEAIWCDSVGGVETRFVGRRSDNLTPPAIRTIEEIEGQPIPVAWCRQVHSDRIRRTEDPGMAGDGDALITDRPGLALAVVTADCVPVLLASDRYIAAVHAGWRGIASKIVSKTLAELVAAETSIVGEATDQPLSQAEIRESVGGSILAWVGPAIGLCCYEVSDEVAEKVVLASDESVSSPGPAGKPHLDLVAAVSQQLRDAGVETTSGTAACTRCRTDELWSYRRDGPGRGRNISWIRRTGTLD